MIITCPECSTRYQADAAKFPQAGRRVKCAKCGHAWHQDSPAPEPIVEVEPKPEEPVAAAPQEPEPAPAPTLKAVEPEPMRAAYVPAAVAAEAAATAAVAVRRTAAPIDDAPSRRFILPAQMGVIFGWGLLIALVAAAIWALLHFRQQIATAWPQTASLYATLGMPVNALGIEFQDVSYKREKQDGQSVLAVTGRLANISAREQAVPQIRAALSDGDGRELYHWSFAASVSTMKPGQSVKFVTRISSPPPGARHLEVRFARTGE